MKRLFFVLCLSTVLLACGGGKTNTSIASKKSTANPVDYAETITQEELKDMLYTYASDEFEGRNTGEKGQKMAVEYLKNQYVSMGISSAYNNDDYFQEVPLQKQKVAEAQVAVNGKSFDAFTNHIVLVLSKDLDVKTSEIIYVGHGIDDENYSDYKNIDVKGKIVLAKAGEPKDANGNYVTSGKTEGTKWTNGRQSLSSKRNAAQEQGAKALLYLDGNLFSRYAPFYQRQAESGFSGRLSLKSDDGDFAFVMINEDLAKEIYNSIADDNTPKVLKTDMVLKAERKAEDVMSENVVAFIKGSEKPGEILVLSAHLDHEGIKNGEVYNGADDDGSGTIALIEIAEAFQQAVKDGYTPKRSILFLHVTGEEKGLLGSRYYTDIDPIFPLENTVADLNIDMIGRIDPKRNEGDRNYVYLIGSDKLSTELHKLSEEINKKYTNIELDYTYNDENDPNRYYYRSDHYNFAKNNVPVIFYFNGTHDDYHKPSDTPDKIEYDLLENRTRLVFYTAWELANRKNRPVVDKAE
ncbi:MAG: M28 family peptidase [Winogradskyella sp.]|uniref:M28 family peptidase n=1 Tax=Winogradskyella sp. TaxID=1883156 RepID=UPI0018216405|nr:M28 family peptidase [Winogradskyella sp.]MBT8243873.1 M28 family peptidase [Winogradskyella sp.]NNK22278.1 M28 family peptidase [Winogradskyella sp.]